MKIAAKNLKRVTGATRSSKISKLEKKNSEISYKIALESIVLLKNEGILPIHNQRVALYGNGVLKTVKGGTGSGEVNERHSISIYEGMKNAGLEITSKTWLSDYEKEFNRGEADFANQVKKKLVHGITHLSIEEFSDAFGMSYEYPYGRPITPADIKESNTDTCFYIVSRQCGEGMDRDPKNFMFHLTDQELTAISFCTQHYKKMTVVLNVGGSMDLRPLDKLDGNFAIVYMGMLGSRGGDAFADVVTGKVSPSGHLTQTWMYKYEDVPFGNEFGKMSPSVLEQNYKEGMYVGYRYYDTFQIPVRYPFGYGLSYTAFLIQCKSVRLSKSILELAITVRNTGEAYSGKEVVQVYISEPQGVLDKPYQRLAAFAKTKPLAPKEEQTLMIQVDFADMGSFFEKDLTSCLEAGDYFVRIGNSSQNTQVCAIISLAETIVLEKYDAMQMRKISFEELHNHKNTDTPQHDLQCNVPRFEMRAEYFNTKVHSYGQPYEKLTDEVQKILDRLSAEECIHLVVGDGLDLMGRPHDYICPGAVGYTTSSLVKKGVPLLIFSDGPAGLRIQKTSALGKKRIRPVEAMGNIFNYLPKWIFRIIHADPKKSKLVYQFATAFPVGNMAAQTWNMELLEQEGQAVSDEMAKYGINFWLAPGINIHRNPLNGRNYEYYGEDPLLAGKLAGAVTRGMQKRRGTYVALKHFCCNSQEEQRTYMSANVSERVLREIYLKAFEIAVKEGKPKGVMTSYNKVNGVYNNNNKRLLENVLRSEWGFDGLVMTDWMATGNGAADAAMCIFAGNDLLMSGMKSDKKRIRQALKQGIISEDDLRKCAGNIIRIARNSDRSL